MGTVKVSVNQHICSIVSGGIANCLMNAFCPDSQETVGKVGKKLEGKEDSSANVTLDGKIKSGYFLNTLGLPWEPSH